jgi:hypothetical protein
MCGAQLVVVAAAELRRCALGWLKRLPVDLRAGAAPEPCFLSWPAHLPTAAPSSHPKPPSTPQPAATLSSHDLEEEEVRLPCWKPVWQMEMVK